jgi:hypothetical protein
MADKKHKKGMDGCMHTGRYSTELGPGSVVGIATGYELDGPWIESRWEARFSAAVQTGPGARPVSCKIGTGLSRE